MADSVWVREAVLLEGQSVMASVMIWEMALLVLLSKQNAN